MWKLRSWSQHIANNDDMVARDRVGFTPIQSGLLVMPQAKQRDEGAASAPAHKDRRLEPTLINKQQFAAFVISVRGIQRYPFAEIIPRSGQKRPCRDL
jgi:hypothetical protein